MRLLNTNIDMTSFEILGLKTIKDLFVFLANSSVFTRYSKLLMLSVHIKIKQSFNSTVSSFSFKNSLFESPFVSVTPSKIFKLNNHIYM